MSKNRKNKFKIYTDGSCDNIVFPNYGGWAYLILENDVEIERKSGYSIHTTNNRMELTAIIESIKELPEGSKVEIITDSKYCIGVLAGGYKAKVNQDLIAEFATIAEDKNLHIFFSWVKGHSGDKYNEIVDKLSNAEYEKASGRKVTDIEQFKNDKGYRKKIYSEGDNEIKKLIAETLKEAIDINVPKGNNYINEKVEYIYKLLKLAK